MFASFPTSCSGSGGSAAPRRSGWVPQGPVVRGGRGVGQQGPGRRLGPSARGPAPLAGVRTASARPAGPPGNTSLQRDRAAPRSASPGRVWISPSGEQNDQRTRGIELPLWNKTLVFKAKPKDCLVIPVLNDGAVMVLMVSTVA